MTDPRSPIRTIAYKTYLKATFVEGLRSVFANHPDDTLRRTRIGIDYPFTEIDYPSIVVRFYERRIRNAGVGHYETLPVEEGSDRYIKYKHYLYDGDIEFAIYTLSSYDRDIISDSLVQTLTMGDMEPYTNQFINRVFNPDPNSKPVSIGHMINVNTDEIQGFGETQIPAPWGPEDVMIYQTSYRSKVLGEFYSPTPDNADYGILERVEFYPYDGYIGEPVPEPDWSGPDHIQGTDDDEPDPALWK